MSNSFLLQTNPIAGGLAGPMTPIQHDNTNIVDSNYSFSNKSSIISKSGKSPIHYPRSSLSDRNSERISQTLRQSTINSPGELPPLETFEEVILILIFIFIYFFLIIYNHI
jgi:hypothetical protein